MWEDDDSNEDDAYDPEEQRRKIEALPIYQKAEEIRELTQRIVDAMDKDNPQAEVQCSLMVEDSIIVISKIAGAEAMDDFILKMENAVLIKMHARNLLTHTSALKMLDMVDASYLQLLRDEIEVFRLLFKKWIATFHHDASKEADGWGLFVDED